MSPAAPRTGEWVLGRIGGAPVVVAPTSLLLGLLIAASWYPLVSSALSGLGLTTVLGVVVATVAGVGVSILLHELAHGLTGTLLGRRPIRYELYLWGGLTTFGRAPATWTPWKDAAVSLSGPATNLALWAAGRALIESSSLPLPAAFAIWALSWVNLALAIFNALPGLPLDGGHALSAAIAQLTGNHRLGLTTAAWGGLAVVAGILWWWVIGPLILDGRQPNTFNLIIVAMISWSIGSTSWRILGLGGGSRAAQRLDLRQLARPLAILPAETPISQVRDLLAGDGLVLVTDADQLLGSIDRTGLREAGLAEAPGHAGATAGQVCTVLPAAAITTELTGPAAAEAMSRARSVSRWLILVEDGRATGAVPTGAR